MKLMLGDRHPDRHVRAWWMAAVLVWLIILTLGAVQVIRGSQLLSERASERVTMIRVRSGTRDFVLRLDDSARWTMETPRGPVLLRQDLPPRVLGILAAARRVPLSAVPDEPLPGTLSTSGNVLRLTLTESRILRRGVRGAFRLPPALRIPELSDPSWWLDSRTAAPLRSSRELAGLVLRLDGASAGAIRSSDGQWLSDTGDREIVGLEERVRDLLADLGHPLPFGQAARGPVLANLRLLPTRGSPVELMLRIDEQGQLLLERSSGDGVLLLTMDSAFLITLDQIASLILGEQPVGALPPAPDQPFSPLLPRFR